MKNAFLLLEAQSAPQPNEGDLYKVIHLYGHTFSIFYGYYETFERDNPEVEPMPIYPDFLAKPQYTTDGFPFVTKMQDTCIHYSGKLSGFSECAECRYYLHGDELIGICTCSRNRLTENNDI